MLERVTAWLKRQPDMVIAGGTGFLFVAAAVIVGFVFV